MASKRLISKIILDLLYPPQCIYCERWGNKLCQECKSYLKEEDFPQCFICESLSIEGETHKYCKSANDLSPDLYRYNYEYNFMSKKIIVSSKSDPLAYSNIDILSNTKSEAFKYLQSLSLDFIVPVPSTNKNKRLVDVVEYFSGIFSEELSLPVKNILTASGQTQKKLDKESRAANAKNKFKLKDRLNNINALKNRRILLVDDVCTTGLSLFNACKLLKEHGASWVGCYTLCKDLRYNYLVNA
jgi:predicted amidophosphoribosyltransferase